VDRVDNREVMVNLSILWLYPSWAEVLNFAQTSSITSNLKDLSAVFIEQ
jgi:hypothetical protein